MKKVLLLLILLAVIVVGVMGYMVFGKQNTRPSGVKSGESVTTPNVSAFKKACEVMTQADAEAILGVGAVKTHTVGASDVVNNDTSVTTCGYQVGAGSTLKQVTVLLRASAPNETKTSFINAKQSDASDVEGLGDSAYWSPTYGQLNVLKGGTWMILSVGTARVSDHTLADSRILAERLVGKL